MSLIACRHTAHRYKCIAIEPSQVSAGPPGAPHPAQQELYDWLSDYIGAHRHSPSIRQMMQAMGLRSPAPMQSRLRHLQQKGWITWQEGQARTLQLLGGWRPAFPSSVLSLLVAL